MAPVLAHVDELGTHPARILDHQGDGGAVGDRRRVRPELHVPGMVRKACLQVGLVQEGHREHRVAQQHQVTELGRVPAMEREGPGEGPGEGDHPAALDLGVGGGHQGVDHRGVIGESGATGQGQAGDADYGSHRHARGH